MTQPNNGQGYAGFQGPDSTASPFNLMRFQLWSLLARVRTCMLVEVMAVTTSGEDGPAGFVDILPLVNQVDGANNVEPHAIIYACPYFRLQGGANAVILDPQVGDIGIAVFADRDISSVIAKRVLDRSSSPQGNPGSARKFSMADGLYVGGVLGIMPTRFIRFSESGIEITADTTLTINGNVVVNGEVTANGIPLSTHHHGGVQTGGGNTGGPAA